MSLPTETRIRTTITPAASESPGSTSTANDASGAAGYYEFDLDPGTYTVCEQDDTPATGYAQSFPTAGAACSGPDSDNAAFGYTFTITSGDVESHRDNDFGNYQQGIKSGYKFEDLDADVRLRLDADVELGAGIGDVR